MSRGCLVLLSGGMDSTTLLAKTLREFNRVEAVFVNYGQRHIREKTSSWTVAMSYGVPWHELDLTGFGASVRSALTTPGIGVPHGHYSAESMAITVVPNRNATFLSAAAGIAASLNLEVVRTAVHAGDHAVYADCRPDFIAAIDVATQLGCGVSVDAPFMYHDKTYIARASYEYRAPVEMSWSCYEGGDRHCGRCGTCVERAEAFNDAAVADPTDYIDTEFWKRAVAEVKA